MQIYTCDNCKKTISSAVIKFTSFTPVGSQPTSDTDQKRAQLIYKYDYCSIKCACSHMNTNNSEGL